MDHSLARNEGFCSKPWIDLALLLPAAEREALENSLFKISSSPLESRAFRELSPVDFRSWNGKLVPREFQARMGLPNGTSARVPLKVPPPANVSSSLVLTAGSRSLSCPRLPSLTLSSPQGTGPSGSHTPCEGEAEASELQDKGPTVAPSCHLFPRRQMFQLVKLLQLFVHSN